MDDAKLREIPFSSQTLYDGAILHVEKWQVTCPNGHEATREIVVHKGAAGGSCPSTPTGRRFWCASTGWPSTRSRWRFRRASSTVRAKIPCCAPSASCARKRAFAAGRMTHMTTILTTPGFCTERIALYLAQDLTQGDMHLDEDEFLSLVRMPLEEAVARVMRGEICDAKTICGPADGPCDG